MADSRFTTDITTAVRDIQGSTVTDSATSFPPGYITHDDGTEHRWNTDGVLPVVCSVCGRELYSFLDIFSDWNNGG